jgi:radical SAM superfamily enzyme YgiQ (UPF0313 family)
MWHGSRLQVRELSEVKAEIDSLAVFTRHGVRSSGLSGIAVSVARQWDGRKLFLQDGDAMAYPYRKLIEAIDYLNLKLPGIERIATYATPQDLLRRSVDELRQLKDRKIGIIYMGIESGDDEVLKSVCKGVTHQQIVEAGRKVKESGIALSVTVILGLGSVAGSDRHARESARILTEIDPDFAGALTLILVPGTPIYKRAESGDFELITPLRSLEELRIMVAESTFTDCFFSSMHASNYFSIRGRLPGDKARMLGELDRICASNDPALLRPEFLRAL